MSALEASLNELRRRHDALRMKFVVIDGRPCQIAAPAVDLSLTPMDLRAIPGTEREIEARRRIADAAGRPFSLARGRMLRVRLLRLRDERHMLALITHHLVADAWSMGILTAELWRLYDDYRLGKAPRFADVPYGYRDFAAWQRERLGADLEPAIDYWRKNLADVPVLDLPTDRPRPVTPSFHGGRVAIEIPASLTIALNRLSQRESATLFMTLLAALQILLCRWSGQDDIAVGAPFANRERAEFGGTVGLFVDMLVLRGDLSGKPGFRQLLGRAREACLGAFAHQAVPFELLARELAPQRGLRHEPLFQVMMVLQNTPVSSAAPAGLSLEPVEIENGVAQFDLSLYLRERKKRLIGYFEYSSDLFDGPTIERMAGHFHSLLQGIVDDPDRPIATSRMLSAAEERQVLVDWNDTAARYPSSPSIHAAFEAQARRTPDAVALEYAAQKLSYRDLNACANGLGRELVKLGVRAGRRVGVLAERSPETIVGILAILKAGGAYVPLDPAYPKERLEFMLADSRCAVLLTQKNFAAYPAAGSAKTLLIDDLLRGAVRDAADLRMGANGRSAAYVIYTSGSTGVPKGVVALHGGALNRFAWMWQTYPFEGREKLCQKTSLSFVDSVWEIFGALLQGVSTVLVPDIVAKDPLLLLDHVAARGVTRLVLVPSLLREILRRGRGRRLRGLKYCFCSGEALSADLVARFRRALPGCRLINLYGSSEVSGDVTFYECPQSDRDAPVPIGKPIGNTQIYLLDDDLQPVPIGARGELYVGGDNLARGYLYRPGLTAQKFIADPFHPGSAARLYRSGDLGRYRADGNIEFLGRRDQQAKIRGCRVELGEVEAALALHPAVGQCLAAIHARAQSEPEDLKAHNPAAQRRASAAASGPSLLAYVVPRSESLSVSALRTFLAQKLPDYMVPTAFVFLPSLPLLPNGKVDRNALPPPPPPKARAVTGPSGEIEALVAEIWRRVLKVDSVAADDNFFELGGHSLTAAEAAEKLRETFRRPLSARDLFAAPTVAGLTTVIEKTIRAGGTEELPPIRSGPEIRRLPLSPAQEPLVVFSQLFGGGDFLNLPYAYRLEGKLDVQALRRAVNEIVRRHAALRSGFRDTGGGAKQFVRRSAQIKLPLIDLAGIPKREREARLERISKQDAAQTFDLENPPLIRATLLRLGAARHILLVTLHHIISDQGSMAVFRRELAALYDAFSRGRPSPLPELAVQYKDFVRWQRMLLEGSMLQRQISYWKERLAPPPRALALGRGRKPASYHSTRRPFECDDGLFGRIKAFARAQSCTPFMVFLAALNILLHRYTGATDIRIGTLVANRGQPGTEGLIGYFVNALVLRTRIAPAMTSDEIIRHVREVCVAAYAHQELPFEHLETLIGGNRPLYRVMLNYRNQSTATLRANGLTIASWNGKHRVDDPGIAISRLDVNIHLRELSTKLTGAVNYKTDLFDEPSITLFLESYASILRQIVDDRSRRINEITVPTLDKGI